MYSTRGGVSDHPFTGMLAHLLRVPGASGFGSGSTAHSVVARWDGFGKVAVVTGGASGLGKECATALASRGCEVVLAVRPGDGGEEAAEQIRARHPGAKVTLMNLDLACLEAVRAFAAAYQRSGRPLHVLVCNAGIMACPFALSTDGHEMQFATNHLGHFLLVDLLKPVLSWTAHASGAATRVVMMSSAAHHFPYAADEGGPLLLDDVSSADRYHRWIAYGHSKLCNLLFARELHRRCQRDAVPITAVAVHPGIINTPLNAGLGVNPTLLAALTVATNWIFKSVAQGAATAAWAATAKDVLGGEYYADCNLCPSSPVAHDADLGGRLWQLSERLVQQQLVVQQRQQAQQ